MEKKGLIIIAIIAVLYWWTRTPVYEDDATQLSLKYHVEYPKGGSSGDNLPIIIALHGNGDTYDNFYKYTLKDFTVPIRVVLIEAPKRYWPYEKAQLIQYSSAIASFADYLRYKFTTNSKPLLLGFSGGAVMAYFTALTQCQHYSSIVPISGMLKPNFLPDSISTDDACKVVAFHGDKDPVLSLSGAKFAIEQLKKNSSNISLDILPAGHTDILTNHLQDIFDKIRILL
jgi:predicted esterase